MRQQRCNSLKEDCSDIWISNSKTNILKDREFLKSREVLLSKKKQLVFAEAKGNRPNAAKELSKAEEDLLFRSSQFGNKNNEALQRTVWCLLALHFGFRAWDKSRKLRWGDIVLQTDSKTGNKVLIWKSERIQEALWQWWSTSI